MSDIQPESIFSIANEYQSEQAIYCVEGTLTKLYAPKSTAHGTLQNGELTDSEGNALKITFADCDQNHQTARNAFVTIESVEGRNGWTGVKVKDDAQYGRAIWVTPTAQITYQRGGGGAPPRQQGPPPRNSPPPQNRRPPQRGAGGPPPQNRQRSGPTPQQGQQRPPSMNQFQAVEQIVDCYAYTFRLVDERMQPILKERHMQINADTLASLISTMTATAYIEVAKSGIVKTWDPKAAPAKHYPPPPTDPRQWRQCVLSKGENEGKTLEELSDEVLGKLFDYYDGQKANHALAECVYQAAQDRGLLNSGASSQGQDPDLDQPEDDIPF
jgi:hypothetical protein